MRFKNPTEEEIAIDEAMEAHLDAMKFESMVFRVAMGAYLISLPLFIFGTDWFERIGIALVFVGILTLLAHFFFHLDTERKRKKTAKLVQPYLKKKSLPLFRELQEKFADDPNIRFTHNDDGSMTITQKREDDDMRRS